MPSHEPEVVPSPRPLDVKETQLIDRAEEMKLLREAVDRAIHGQGGLVFLHGEAGIGKTRLARELGAYARLRGMQVLYGRCPALFRMDGVPPYVLWSEVLRDYLEACSPEQLYRVVGFYPSEVAKLVPELGQKLGAVPQSLPVGPEHERDRLFEAVFQFIVNASKQAPLLVFLDDLQWTDQTSLLLLHYLARGIHKTPLLLLGAYRETDIDEKHPLSPVLTELNRERLLKPVALKRMSSNDVSEMIRQILGQEEVPKEFCQLVYEKTRGNPFFVEEVLESLKEEAVIFREENQWKIKEVSKIEFPETVKSVIKTRINRLDDECQNILTLASFIGNDFSFEALHGVIGIEENRLLELMERMLKTGLVEERAIRGEDVYCFADVIVRDVVHEEVSHLRHKKLHSSVGDALEKVYAKNVDQHFGELAYHFLEAGDKDKALDYFLKAGERAQKVYAHNEAFSYFQHALELLEEQGNNLERKAHIIESLGNLKWWMGEPHVCLEYWNMALDLWDQLEDKKNVARLHAWMGSLLWQSIGERDKASKHHSMALETLEKEPESAELAGLYEDISHMLWRSGKPEALSWAQKAFELAEKLGNQQVLTGCYNDLGTISLKSGEHEKALKYYEQGLKMALKNNLLGYATSFYNNLNSLYWSIGELQKSFEIAQKGSELVRKAGSLYGMAWLDVALATSYAYMGEVQKAISMSEEVLALDKRNKYTAHVSVPVGLIGVCYLVLGEWAKSRQYLMEAYDMAKKVGEYQFSAEAGYWLGELSTEMEDYVEAEKYLNESNSAYQEAGDTDTQVALVLPALSKLYLKKGEIEKAEELIEKIYEYAAKTKSMLVMSRVEMLKAMLLREQKNWDQSIQHFEKSFQGCKSLDAQKWYVEPFADLLYEYGSTYLARNEEGDQEKGFSLLNQALDIYQDMGAIKRVEKIRSRMVREETAHEVVSKLEPTEVSERVRGYIPTGYVDLNRSLYGGIPANYAVALTSPSCDEMDMLIKSFLETGAKNGEATFYVTIDPSLAENLANEFQSNFYLFVCNPQADTLVRDSPNIFKLKGVENLTDISIALTSAIRKLDPVLKGPRRICMGLVSDVLLQHHAVQTRRWLTGLISELRSNGFTTLAVMDPEMHPSQEVRAVLDLFEGQIDIYEKETEKGLQKFLKIRKMRNQKYLENELPLRKEEPN